MSEPRGARFGIIGLGQIGGSLAKALKLRGLAELVSGFDIDAKLQHEALQRGVIDHAAKSTAELIGLSEIVIIAVPIAGIEETLDRHAEILSEKLLVTDTGSLKQAIVQLADEKNLANFVGGHPLAGTEKRATAAWDGNLFAGANYFYAATPNGNTTATELLQQLLRSIDAEPISVQPAEHDKIFGTTSNLPHLFAYCLRHVYDSLPAGSTRKHDFVCPSFYGATRIAASDPEMVHQMLWHNRDNLSQSLEVLRTRLQAAQEALDSGDQNRFRQIFDLNDKQ